MLPSNTIDATLDADATLDGPAAVEDEWPDDTPDPFTLTTEEEEEQAFPDFPMRARYQEGFSICDEESAGWLVDKILSKEEQRERIKAQAADMINAINRDIERLQNRFGAELELWAMGEIASRGAKSKTIKLLQGNIAIRTVPTSVRIADPEAALVEARTAYPQMIQTAEFLDTAAYREAAKTRLEEYGELLPGVESVPARQSVSIKAATTRKDDSSNA